MINDEDKKISAAGYGFVIVSAAVFEARRKERRIKERKMIAYFSKDNDAFYDFISKGSFIPLHHLNYDRYTTYFSIGKYDEAILKNWRVVTTWESFNLHIDNSNAVWAMEIEEMEKWNVKKLNEQGDYVKGVYYDVDDVEFTEYKAVKYSLPEGKYDAKIYGLKRKITTKDGMENYGFLFELTKIDAFTSKVDASEVNFRSLFE
jgi:hypothetical protein